MLKKVFKTPRFFGFRRNHNNSLTTSSVSSYQRGIRFCIWVALKFENLSFEPYCLVNRILFHKNWYSIYWEALELLKQKGVLVTSDSVRALVRSYSYMGYTEKAIESFVRMREFGVEPDAHMYNTILRDVLNEKLLELALALYTTMLKSNVDPNFYTYNMLIDGLCKRGEVKGAHEMLDEMKRVGIVPCVLSMTSILYTCCQVNNVDEAHMLFDKMMKEKDGLPPPDMISCNVVLNGFCKMGRLEEALSFVWLIKKDGFSLNRNSYSSLINGFFKARRYREAHVWYTKMFKEGIVPDVVLYAIMIRGLSEEGRVGEAGKMLEEMTQIGLTPDAYCYNAVIQGLCDVGLLNRAQSLHLEIFEHNVCTHTILICEMCKRGMVAEAKELFNRMEKLGCEPSVVTFNALINGLCKAKNLEEAMNLLYKMQVGRRHSLHLSLSQGSGQVSDSLQKKVKEMCEAGQVLKAYKLITDHAGELRPDIISYNILINAFCLDREVNAAYNLFEELQKWGLSPDSVTYGTIIKGLFIVDREDDAFMVFQRMQKTGSEPILSVYKTIMTCLCRKSKVSRAFTLYLGYLKSLPSRDNDSINTLEKYLFGEKLEQVIRGLLELDFKARDFTLAPYTILLIGFCQAGKVSEALIIFSVLDEFNIKINATSCVHLIRGLCKEQRLYDAVRIFRYSFEKGFMLKPMICNHLLTCLLYSRDYKECAVDLIGRMESFGYRLNSEEEFGTTLTPLHHYRKGKKRKITLRKD